MPRWIVAGSEAIQGRTRVVIDESDPCRVDIDSFASLSRNCPYHGMAFSCRPEEVLA
jgi:hypothetical protein